VADTEESTNFCADLALLTMAAIKVPAVMPVTLHEQHPEHDDVFRVEIGRIGTAISIIISSQDAWPLASDALDEIDNPDLYLQVLEIVEQAEEEYISRMHRAVLVGLLAESEYNMEDLRSFCHRADIDIDKGPLDPEQCSVIAAWLTASEMRRGGANRQAFRRQTDIEPTPFF
jgi:hypothetical protein